MVNKTLKINYIKVMNVYKKFFIYAFVGAMVIYTHAECNNISMFTSFNKINKSLANNQSTFIRSFCDSQKYSKSNLVNK